MGDNRDSLLHGEATRQYHRCLPRRHFIAFSTWYNPGACEGIGYSRAQQWQLAGCVLRRSDLNITSTIVVHSGASVFCACSKMHSGIRWTYRAHANVIAQCNWDAMHAPHAFSVAQFVLPQCKLGSDHRSTPNMVGNFSR